MPSEDVHAQRVAADVSLVASALLTHLEALDAEKSAEEAAKEICA